MIRIHRIPLDILVLWSLVGGLVSGLDSIETYIEPTGERQHDNSERVWGSAAEATKMPDEATEETKPTSGGVEEKGRGWGGPSVPDVVKSSVEDALVDEVVELIHTETVDEKERPENSAPEKTGGNKRVWGASETETHTKHADDVSKVNNGSDSSTTVHNRSAPERKLDAEELARESKRVWGSHDAEHPLKGEGSASDETSHIPFIASKHLQNQHNPPEGFTLAARVYIGTDKLAHFDYDDDKRCSISLPYFDCGASGSTTAPVPVKHAYFRHSLSAPTVWVDPDMHPVLAVALAPFTMELDSGESLEFRAGDVVLLEDSLRPGHRMIVSDNHSLSILFVTLPQPHYHTGKQHLSLKKAVAQKTTPCLERNGLDDFAQSRASSIRPSVVWDARRIRLVFLGTVALSISTLAADFLGKTAPLWLAVGVGGTCFVVGSTYGLTLAGDYVFTALELWRERRRLESQTSK
jgi:hypothetical protein